MRAAFAELPPRCQHLLALLLADPSVSYAEISARLEMPVGSIGPNRARCLDRLRRSPAIRDLLAGDTDEGGTGRGGTSGGTGRGGTEPGTASGARQERGDGRGERMAGR